MERTEGEHTNIFFATTIEDKMNKSPAKVATIKVKNIEPNPHNPRRLFDEKPMMILKESIQKLNILVPLDVYPKEETRTDSEKDKFVLLDGERRWKCAKALDFEYVPCIVIEKPSEEENILTMFHIHNVRVGWQLMPTALKLKMLMKMLGTTSEDKLTELTKLSRSQVRRCKILLTFPVKHQEMMLAPVEDRFKADFFIDLHRIRGPALSENFPPWIERGDEKCIDIMISKYRQNVIKAVTEFRTLASIYSGAKRIKEIDLFYSKLDNFFDTPEMKISDIKVASTSFEQEIKEISKSSKRLFHQINTCPIEGIASDENLISDLKKLARLINTKLEKALLNEPREPR